MNNITNKNSFGEWKNKKKLSSSKGRISVNSKNSTAPKIVINQRGNNTERRTSIDIIQKQ